VQQQQQRVEVDGAPEQTPVQQHFTRCRRAGMAGQQQGHEVAGRHLGADGDEGEDGLVRRAQRVVGHDEDAAAGEQAGVRDGAGAGGADGGGRAGGEVDAAVTWGPPGGRGVEGAAYDDGARERRDPAGGVGVGGCGA
jgi:hypothetical protein